MTVKKPITSLSSEKSTSSKAAESIEKRRRVFLRLRKGLPIIRNLLVIIGISWLLVIPWSGLARNTFVSENAIQPAQARTFWDWKDVKVADRIADEVERVSKLPSEEKAGHVVELFQKMGLTSFVQKYKFNELLENYNGTNVIAILPASKTDGAETLVLGASWLSRAVPRETYPINVRGVASVISMAHHFRKFNFWSKDIVFVISEGYLDGMQAFVAAYHNDMSDPRLSFDSLQNQPGPIWAALTLDYPYHSFDTVGIYHESANGLLPNFDYVSTTTEIVRWVTRAPLRLHGTLVEFKLDNMRWWILLTSYMPFVGRFKEQVREYMKIADSLIRHFSFSAFGRPAGPEGLFGRYGIDAIGIFGVPAHGPHGFYAMGMTTESIFRSLNNLLERMHASTFFYLLPAPGKVVALGNYLPAPLCLGASITVGAIESWFNMMDMGEKEGTTSKSLHLWLALRPILVSFSIRAILLSVIPAAWYIKYFELTVIIGSLLQLIAMKLSWHRKSKAGDKEDVTAEKYRLLIKSFSLSLAGVTITAMSIINFPAGVLLSLIFALNSISGMPHFITLVFHPLTMTIFIRVMGGESSSLLLWIKSTILDGLISNNLFLTFYFAVFDPIWLLLWISHR